MTMSTFFSSPCNFLVMQCIQYELLHLPAKEEKGILVLKNIKQFECHSVFHNKERMKLELELKLTLKSPQ